ncbi:S8 family serine peptidase [Capilliphycus salinus ALCB114379]|uniref:S8 family serine peptidase n=1 Tax=Capilliphycus salinus TaxID=2768948 RepID=UPI0039A5198B
MFDAQQADWSGLHLVDLTTPEPLNSPEWNGYSDPIRASVPQLPALKPLEPTLTAEVWDHHPDPSQNHLTTDPVTGENLSDQFGLPVVDDTLITAQNLGLIEGTQTVSDSVGIFDLDDYYRIELHSASNLHLSLDGLIADADLQLIDDRNSDGFVDYDEIIDYSLRWDNFPENISATLPAGTYYINVTQFSGSTPYTLNLSATPIPVNESVSGFDAVDGYGLINASAAVSQAIGSPVPFVDVPDTLDPNWGVNRINAPEVWSQGYTGEGVVVAVLDTGVDYNHPDLDSRIWQNIDEIPNNGIDDDGNGFRDDVNGWDFIDYDRDPMDLDGHGTHVAGVIAAENNEFGITGVAPNAQIMPVRVLTDDQGGIYSVVSGIRYAVDNGADVINMSLGFESYSSYYYHFNPLQEAIQYATDNGVVVVSSAGNDGEFVPKYPANYATEIGIAVGASDFYNHFADFSNQAGFNPLDYVVAPGVDIYSTTPNNNYEYYEGTSMAAPHVAGVAALMLSANPNLTVAEVEQILTQTANPSALIA